MKEIKKLYEFSVVKTETTTTPVDKEIDGHIVSVNEKVETKTEKKFCIKRPGRSLYDASELFYSVATSKGLEAGLMSAALLAKRFQNDGGIFSEDDKEAYGNKVLDYFRVGEDLERALLVTKDDRTPEQQVEVEGLVKSRGILMRELQEYEMRSQSLFAVTAETRARTQTIVWWMLFLLHHQNEAGEWEEFFPGATDKEKLAFYYGISDDDSLPQVEQDYFASITDKALRAVTHWYYNRAASQSELEKAVNDILL